MPQAPDARRLIPDHEAAAADWYKKYGCTQINTCSWSIPNWRRRGGRDRGNLPDTRRKQEGAGLTGKAIDHCRSAFEAVSKSISMVNQYAHEQRSFRVATGRTTFSTRHEALRA